MRKLILITLFAFIVLVGCSNDEAYNNAIQKGLDYVASEEYPKAESAFELALDEKSEDETATVLLSQTIDYQELVKAMEEGEYDLAKEKVDAIIELDGGSSALVKKSEDALASIKDLEGKLTEITKDYERAQKQFKAQEYDKAQKTIDHVLKKDLDNMIFKSLKADSKSLQKDIKSSLDAEAKVEEERIAKEKAEEEERIAKEKAAEEERVAKQKAEEKAAREAEEEKPKSELESFSADRAIQLAQNQYGNDSDTGYSVFNDLEHENGKAYYLVRLYSKEMQAGGGSGTLFVVKVFEDGTIKESY